MTDVAAPAVDPRAEWVLGPGAVAGLTARLVASGPPRAVTAPATGLHLAQVPTSTPEDVARAARTARAAQQAWAATSLADRAAVLLRLHDLVLDRQSEGLDLCQLENGKARAHAYEELVDVAMQARHYARRGARYLAPRRVPGLVPVLTSTRVLRHPVGLVGVVAPFNYPFTLTLGDAVPALMAGNAVLLKPDPQTTLTALWLVGLAHDAGLPPGLLEVVSGGADVGAAVVDAVDHVVFTGSTEAGRAVAERAARRLVPVTLELGGKNPLYVADDVDPAVAAEGAVRACFSSTGQLCFSAERLLVHEAVADAFLAELVPRVEAMRLGPALDYSVDLGSLTTPAQLARVRAHVEDAVDRGAVVLAGGRHRPDVGPLFHEPTVLDEVPAGARVLTEETFGPVVTVQRVRDDDHAVALANDSAFGLNASVWTADLARGRRVAERIECGAVGVNDGYVAVWGSGAAPLAGHKDSGLGARHGAEGILATTWTQSVATVRGAHRGLGLGRLYGLGPEAWTDLFTRGLRAVRRLGLP